jgi:hypothetical protein
MPATTILEVDFDDGPGFEWFGFGERTPVVLGGSLTGTSVARIYGTQFTSLPTVLPPTSAPEPTSAIMFGIGAALLAGALRRNPVR